MEISLAAEKLFSIGSIDITNTVFTAFVIVFLILLLALYIRAGISYRAPGKFAVLIEMAVEGLYGLASDVIGTKHVKALFGFAFTFFIFVVVSNWFGLLPIVPALSIEKSAHEESQVVAEESDAHADEEYIAEAEVDGHEAEEAEHEQTFWECLKTKHCYLSTDGVKEFHNSTHVLRAPTSDLSMGLALALISVVVTNVLGFIYAGRQYLKKYLNFTSGITTFVGILEIVSEFGKLISFSFRLFGNIFAGEILLVVITNLTFGVATLPFLALEIFVGVIQAFVFFMLTAVFIGLAINHHDH